MNIVLIILLTVTAIGVTGMFVKEFKKLFIHTPIRIDTEMVTLTSGSRLHMQNIVPVWMESRGPFTLKNTHSGQLIEINQAEDVFSKSVNKIYMKPLAQFAAGTWEIKSGEDVTIHFDLPASGFEDSRIWAKVAYSIVFGGVYLIYLTAFVICIYMAIQYPDLIKQMFQK